MQLSTAVPTGCGVELFENSIDGSKHKCTPTYTTDSICSGAFHSAAGLSHHLAFKNPAIDMMPMVHPPLTRSRVPFRQPKPDRPSGAGRDPDRFGAGGNNPLDGCHGERGSSGGGQHVRI